MKRKSWKLGHVPGHRIRWFGQNGDGTETPRNSIMAGRDWGWDAKCSCGWQTHTGGAIQEYIRREVYWHKWSVQFDREQEEEREDELAGSAND